MVRPPPHGFHLPFFIFRLSKEPKGFADLFGTEEEKEQEEEERVKKTTVWRICLDRKRR
jgi:hypothetical protein